MSTRIRARRRRARRLNWAPVMNERPRLINLAYRLLGSLAEAEDAVQEAYARWYAMSRASSRTPSTPRAPG